MDGEHRLPGAGRVIFVNSVPNDIGQRSAASRQAKAHTARVNWQRYKGRAGSQQPLTERVSDAYGAPNEAGPYHDEERFSITTASRTNTTEYESMVEIEDAAYMGLSTSADNNQQHPPDARASWLGPAIAPLRTVSPVFGALPARSFDVEDSTSVAHMADYLCNVVLKNTLQPSEISAWFLGFSQSPMIFHTLSYAVGVHQGFSGSLVTERQQQQMLMHKGKTIGLINERLGDLDNADIEAIMLAMFVLWRANPRSQAAERSDTSLFSPHMPGANWISVYGQSESIDAHAQALYWLVDRAGGATKLQFPGLQFVLSIGDLLESSARCTHPRFPCVWRARHCLQTLQPMLAADMHTLGVGFTYRVPGGLPSRALEIYQDLVKVDRLFDQSRQRRLDDAFYALVVAARNGKQYALLALPQWPDIPEEEREGSHRAIYGVCRLTTLIYANSVLFPMPASTGWLTKSLGELRQLLEMSNLPSWREDTSALLLWSLFVAGIAAFRTRHRRFFRDSLRALLISTRIATLTEAEAIMREFLWTDSACGQGAIVVWETLELESG